MFTSFLTLFHLITYLLPTLFPTSFSALFPTSFSVLFPTLFPVVSHLVYCLVSHLISHLISYLVSCLISHLISHLTSCLVSHLILTYLVLGSFKLIDLGSTTKFGNQAEELTPRFYLDANVHETDHKLDLYCIATTLALCAGVKDNTNKPLTSLSCTTAATLRSLLAPYSHKAAKIAVLCLDPALSFNCENALQAVTLAGLINK
jgi:hypothetical protein